MEDSRSVAVVSSDLASVPPPRRGRGAKRLEVDALHLLHRLEVLPLVIAVVAWAAATQRRLPARTRRRGGRRVCYADASILVIAVIAQLWQLSSREVCAWLSRWPALAQACGLPAGRVIDPAHFTRRLKRLGPYPAWLLYLALVWQAIRVGLIGGRDVVLDSTLLAAWSRQDRAAAWSFPAPKPKGRVFGYKVHVLLDRASRLPVCFLVSPANRHDSPFAAPLLRLARFGLGLAIRVVRADGAYWGLRLVRFIRFSLGAIPIIPFNRKKQPLAAVRHLVWWPVSYAARSLIERFFAVAKRYYHLDTQYAIGWDAVVLRVTLTHVAILLVALLAHQAGVPALRLSPSRVLAHYQPVGEVA
jgi:hypothetical protein